MFENVAKFFRRVLKTDNKENESGKEAKERLHLVLMQDRANVSADFLEMMKQEIIEVIKKYIEVDENAIDVRLTNQTNTDGSNGAPALYANIPIINIKEEESKTNIEKNETKKDEKPDNKNKDKVEELKDDSIENDTKTEEVEDIQEKNEIDIEEKESKE